VISIGRILEGALPMADMSAMVKSLVLALYGASLIMTPAVLRRQRREGPQPSSP
jgi:hypothetical protein